MNNCDIPATPPRDRKLLSALVAIALSLLTWLTGCGMTQVTAEERIFLDLSLEFLDEYQLPKMSLEDAPVGGLSAIAYDRDRDRFYALSDDRSQYAPARFYTLKMDLNTDATGAIALEKMNVEAVTFLKQADGTTYPWGAINAEGIALSPQKTVFISSEGVTRLGIPPFIHEFDLQTGQWLKNLPIPDRYVPDAAGNPQRGVQDNLGFESLTINPGNYGSPSISPWRVFTATEAPLIQDRDLSDSETQPRNRLLHYLISDGPPIVVSEHLYPLDIGPHWSLVNTLTELLAIDGAGHFLSLERSLGLLGYNAQIFQISTAAATDTSSIASLKGELKGIEPVRKKLLLDLGQLGITLDNLEGMALGPRLPDGSQSLMVVSDNNFDPAQITQFLLFRLKISDS